MAFKINFLFTVLLFNVLFIFSVTGGSPSDNNPTQAPAPAPIVSTNISAPAPIVSTNISAPAPIASTNISAPAPIASVNISAPAPLASSPPTSCNCSLGTTTVTACSNMLLQGRTSVIARIICCKGLRGLKEEDKKSCVCSILKSNISAKNPRANLTVPEAMKVVSSACGF